MPRKNHSRTRRKNRGRFGPLFKLLCALAVVIALTMGATVFFQVETIAVTGNSRYTQQEVIEASGIQIGDNLYRMNKYQIGNQVLQRLPYVEQILIRRSLPSTIVITVSEWDAVAQILPPEPGAAAGEPEQPAEDPESGASGSQEAAHQAASESWLISVGGKLLEPAPAGSDAIEVTGLTALAPEAGTMLVIPEAEQPRLDALLDLLATLEEMEAADRVSSIQLSDTQVKLRYLERFEVKMPLNADFSYKLRVLEQAVAKAEEEFGSQASGTMDLTQQDYAAVYSPD